MTPPPSSAARRFLGLATFLAAVCCAADERPVPITTALDDTTLSGFVDTSVRGTAVPEPSNWLLFGVGGTAVVFAVTRRRMR